MLWVWILWNDEQGQDLIEYTLLMAFVALASAALFIEPSTAASICTAASFIRVAAASALLSIRAT